MESKSPEQLKKEDSVRKLMAEAKDQATSGSWTGMNYAETPAGLVDRVSRRIEHVSGEVVGLHRIHQILSLHPEFETYLELTRLLDRHGF